uniref:Peptidase metallopeptidase domain-containing protein n=1 Tax=Varanus komodoensis TaxID=61221 RepID=A0A8D2JDU2_VARKO
MKSFLLTVALCGALCGTWPVVQEAQNIEEKDMELKYMENYYPDSSPIPVVRSRSINSIPTYKIKQMQKFLGLKVTGKLDPSTLKIISKPRCGVPDIGEFSIFPRSPTWGKKHLTYRILNYTPDMHPAAVNEAIERAWKIWSDVTPLTFTQVYNIPADIDISFVEGNHGDGFPFYGPGGQLAHAFSPEYGGDAHFDEAEFWSEDLKGTNLFLVAAHEFGHSLGLQHSNVQGSLMYPHYQPWDPRSFSLHTDDIVGIQYLYGSPEDSEGSSENNAIPTNIPTEAPSTDMCDPHLTFDAVTTLRRETVFFKDSFFWRKFPQKREIEKTPISAFWPVLSSGVDAAYENEDDDTVFLFKGKKYWAAKGSIIQPGFPKNIHHLGFPRTVKKIDAAAHDIYSKKTYFFSGNSYWRYDEAKHSMEKGYPRKITVDFPEIGPNVDAAFLDYESKFDIFTGSVTPAPWYVT